MLEAARLSATERDIHVVPHPDGWAVTRARGMRTVNVYLTRRFAVDAAGHLAKRLRVALFVHGHDGRIDFWINHPERLTSSIFRRLRDQRSARDVRGPTDDDGSAPELPSTRLLHLMLPYDAWCVRAARRESMKALEGVCARALIDEMTIVITELVLQATIQRRDECTLFIDRIGDEIMVVVRGGTQDETGSQPPSDGRSVWARFDLKRGNVAGDDVS